MNLPHLTPLVIIFTVALLIAACQPDADSAPMPIEQGEGQTTETDLADGELDSTDKSLTIDTNYLSPAGPEDVSFTLVLDEDGTITQAHTEVLGKAPISIMRQESFAEDLPNAVVGRQLSELTEVDRVGGSSLTTAAFNEALAQFKAQL